MKCTVAHSDLIKLIDRCRSATDAKSETATAQSILLTATEQSLSAFATDNIQSVYSETSCAVKQEGACVLNGEKIRNAVKAMPPGLLTLKVAPVKHSTTLTCAGSSRRYVIHGLNPDHYPARPDAQGDLTSYTIPTKLLKETVGRIKSCCAAPGPGRMHIAGVMLEFTERDLQAIAIEGTKMSHFSHKDDFSHPAGCLFLPVGAFSSVLGISTEHVTFSYTANQVFAQGGVERVSFMLPEGSFPDWRAIVSNLPQKLYCKVDVHQLLTAVRGVTAVTKGELCLKLKDSSLSIALDRVPDDQSEDEIPVDAPSDNSFVVRCTASYLIDLLEGIGGGIAEVRFDHESLSVPLVLVSDDGLTAIVQPLRPD